MPRPQFSKVVGAIVFGFAMGLWCDVLLYGLVAQVSVATEQVAEPNPADTAKMVAAELDRLDDADFRARELARYRIEQHPQIAMTLIEQRLVLAPIHVGEQLVSLLDVFANNSDPHVSSTAFDMLKRLSNRRGTALATFALKSIEAIEAANQQKAYELLTHLGANIGHLNLNINGSQSELFSQAFYALEIKSDSFTGDMEDLNWIRYLKSVEVVSLEGPIVDRELLELVAKMPGVKKILLRRASIEPKDLLPLKELADLQHLEFSYMPITDEFVPVLCELPLSQSLRLYGTQVTPEGKEQLASKLDGLEIYRSAGGFLGIASPPTGEVEVTRVVPESAAHKAGIRVRDVIREIDGKPIKNFAALRETLSTFGPEQIARVKLERPMINENGQQVMVEMELTVVLGVQEN